jgi:hypothetical protein
MTEAFARTLQTAADAERVSALLERAAGRLGGLHPDIAALRGLAERYRDYAAALRETVGEPAEPPPEAQAALL